MKKSVYFILVAFFMVAFVVWANSPFAEYEKSAGEDSFAWFIAFLGAVIISYAPLFFRSYSKTEKLAAVSLYVFGILLGFQFGAVSGTIYMVSAVIIPLFIFSNKEIIDMLMKLFADES